MTQKRSEHGPSMEDEDGHFGERVAGSYEQPARDMFEPSVLEPAVDMLADLADSGRALELGIRTGRIALPLARRGIPVHGIELSRDERLCRLNAKVSQQGGAEQNTGFAVEYTLDGADLAQQPVEVAQRVGAELGNQVPATIGRVKCPHFRKAA
jgi:hypothetical protein